MRFLKINMKKFLPILLLVFVFSPTFLFVVDETQQAIITELGEYKRTISKPGLSFKKPFIEKVTKFDNRILSTDAPPGEYLTLDKKRLVVDFIARWKIVDPLVFFKMCSLFACSFFLRPFIKLTSAQLVVLNLGDRP